MALVTLDEAREYLRVDSHEEDADQGVLLMRIHAQIAPGFIQRYQRHRGILLRRQELVFAEVFTGVEAEAERAAVPLIFSTFTVSGRISLPSMRWVVRKPT